MQPLLNKYEVTLEDGKIFHFLVREHEHASGVGLVEDTLGVIQRHGLVSSTTASHLKGWLHNEEGLGVRVSENSRRRLLEPGAPPYCVYFFAFNNSRKLHHSSSV